VGLGARDTMERLDHLAKALDSLEVDGSLQDQILEELVEGSRTVGELVEVLYGVRRSDPGFSTSYMKVRRAVKRLEGRGYVSVPVLGKEKPCRLTRLGSRAIAEIPRRRSLDEALPIRILVIGTTIALGLATFTMENLDTSARAQVSTLFLIFVGMSIMIALSWVSEVW